MRHSALRRIVGLMAILAFLAAPLNASMMMPMAMQAATAAVVSDGSGETPPCDGCDHGQMALRDCMAMCASSLFTVPRAEVIADVPLRSKRPALPALMRAGLDVSPEPHPPKLSR